MPLPWISKNRVTQFSQIIADLHSSKRGVSSLVVQIGFPASLVDLFIKNRSRFTRRKSNKPFHFQTSDPPSPEIPSLISCTFDCAESDRNDSPSLTMEENLHVNDGVVDSRHGVNRVGRDGDGSGSKTLLVTFLMMLVIVVSIACVEKLTVGITVSAFALLFLEYARKRVVLCSEQNVEIKVVGGESCVSDPLSFEETKVVGGESCVINSLSFQEIKIVGEESCVSDFFSLEETKVVGVCSEKTCSDEDVPTHSDDKVVDSCQVSIKGSRSVKLKSKLKKLLTKKLHGSRKEGKEKRGRECQIESGRCEKGSSICVKKDFELKEESKSPLLHNVKLKNMTYTSDEKRKERVGNSSYLVLFVIALVGLVVGRLPAMILTMTWCFMLKIVAIRGRSKATLINCSIPNS